MRFPGLVQFLHTAKYSFVFRSIHAAAKEANSRADRVILCDDDRSVVQDKQKTSNGLRTKVRTMFECYDAALKRVTLIEEDLGIEKRWMPGDVEYESASKDLQHRKYCHALDNLENLVIQCMFELAKLGMSGLGMSFPRALRLTNDTVL